MSRIPNIILIVLLVIPCLANAETINVHIKGIDDGIRSSIQQDYKEAVLFAKREAVERAGVKIKSKSMVKDFVLYGDYIESEAEAVLLPGYNIVGMGYSTDGTYQIVLIGKVKVKSSGIHQNSQNYTEDVTIEKHKCKDCLTSFVAETTGVSTDKDELNARILAERIALKKIRKKLVTILSAMPYNFDTDDAIIIYGKGNILEVDYEKNEHAISAHVKYSIKIPR